MNYKWFYQTPKGFSDMLMKSDGEYLTGLWFVESKDASKHAIECEEKMLSIFEDTIRWLDIYFSGNEPDFIPRYRIENLTDFRREVIEYMLTIPYGKVITYGDIAQSIAKKRGINRMSSQAVGGAVGWNPICIIVPCHRVIGTKNNLTGYGGGMENKISLLKIERHDMSKFIVQKTENNE